MERVIKQIILVGLVIFMAWFIWLVSTYPPTWPEPPVYEVCQAGKCETWTSLSQNFKNGCVYSKDSPTMYCGNISVKTIYK